MGLPPLTTVPCASRLSWAALAVGAAVASIGTLLTGLHPQAYLPGVLIMGVSASFLAPEALFCVLVFLIPFSTLRGDMHLYLGVCLIAGAVARGLVCRGSFSVLRSNLWPWLGIFLAINLLSTALSDYPETARWNLIRLCIAQVFIALSISIVSADGFLRLLPFAIAGSVSAASLFAVYGYAFNDPMFVEKIELFKRGTGGAPSPVSLSMMIVFILPLIVYFLMCARTIMTRALAAVAVFVNLAGMISTYSRGGFLLFPIVGALALYQNRDSLRRHHIGLGAGLVVAMVVFSIVLTPQFTSRSDQRPADRAESVSRSDSKENRSDSKEKTYHDGGPPNLTVLERVQSLSDEKDHSLSRRQAYLIVGWEAFKERPIIGAGTYVFSEIFAQSEYSARFKRKLEKGRKREAHNTYVEVLVGTGVLGFMAFAALLGRVGLNFYFANRALAGRGDHGNARLVAAMGLSLVAFILYFAIQTALFHKFFLLTIAMSELARRYSASNETVSATALRTPDSGFQKPKPSALVIR